MQIQHTIVTGRNPKGSHEVSHVLSGLKYAIIPMETHDKCLGIP